MAAAENRNKPVVLCCPKCDKVFEWELPRDASTIGLDIRCPTCQADYPMACHDCGLDLHVDGFEVRRLKRQASSDPDSRTSGLFCQECTENYDRFAINDTRKVPCARCKALVPAGSLTVRSLNRTEVTGAVAWHQTAYLGLCPKCARKVDTKSSKMMLCFAVIFLGFLAFVFLSWLLN